MSRTSQTMRIFARVCAALALGFLAGPYSTVHRQTPGIAVAIAALFTVALAFGALADHAIKRKLVGMLLAAIALCGAGAGIALLIVWLVGWTQGAPDLIVVLEVALAPVVAGFALSRVARKNGELFKTATVAGMLTWVGVVAHFIAYWNVRAHAHAPQTTTPATGVGGRPGPSGLNMVGFVLTGVAFMFTVGFVYAAGAGLLGAGARRGLARLTGRP